MKNIVNAIFAGRKKEASEWYNLLCQGYTKLLCQGYKLLCQGYKLLWQGYNLLCQGYYNLLWQGNNKLLCQGYNNLLCQGYNSIKARSITYYARGISWTNTLFKVSNSRAHYLHEAVYTWSTRRLSCNTNYYWSWKPGERQISVVLLKIRDFKCRCWPSWGRMCSDLCYQQAAVSHFFLLIMFRLPSAFFTFGDNRKKIDGKCV